MSRIHLSSHFPSFLLGSLILFSWPSYAETSGSKSKPQRPAADAGCPKDSGDPRDRREPGNYERFVALRNKLKNTATGTDKELIQCSVHAGDSALPLHDPSSNQIPSQYKSPGNQELGPKSSIEKQKKPPCILAERVLPFLLLRGNDPESEDAQLLPLTPDNLGKYALESIANKGPAKTNRIYEARVTITYIDDERSQGHQKTANTPRISVTFQFSNPEQRSLASPTPESRYVPLTEKLTSLQELNALNLVKVLKYWTDPSKDSETRDRRVELRCSTKLDSDLKAAAETKPPPTEEANARDLLY